MTEHPTDQLESFALRLLPPESELEVGAHIEDCASCTRQLLAIERTLGLLALAATPRQPPATAEERLFARVAELRHAEHVSRLAASGSAAALSDGQPRSAMVLAAPVRGPSRLLPRPQWMRAREPLWPARYGYVLAALAAVLFLVIGVLGAQLHVEQTANARLTAQLQTQQTAVALLSSSNAVVRRLTPAEPVAAGAAGTMAMDSQRNAGVLVLSHLPKIAPGKSFQFWIVSATGSGAAEQTAPIQTFTATADGSAVVRFIPNIQADELRQAGISIEPAGGAKHPDSPMILLLSA